MIKCIAVDDEPLALSQLAGYISRVPFLELVASCQDAFEAMKVLSEKEVDLIFLDINMPDLSGLDLVRSLIVKPLVVFTTAYPQYAIDGFKLDAVDYLLKPLDFHDLLKAADKARKYMELRQVSESDSTQLSNDGSLFVKADYKVVRINISEIKYIEGMSEYVRIFVEGEDKPVMTLLSMKKIEERLPASQFMRVHRSYIVNLQKITEISRLRIIFGNNVYIPVGDNYKDRFLEYINKMSVGK
ncbi:LytTR family DNA-binding domain-containing protein [Bacteroides sp. 51]|uniref:LytR/AlgR family response regulator transcription factor n=1 Tax=Bacteroides sp. 51 TaxID=2302938 RepID=UPI0013D3FDD3|nr:LytTR family DNA-binding domain-containing protein [Bacteroides sp. 51]NDV82770.1 DNA-binding response regulator [Bacteroides sp. 51]